MGKAGSLQSQTATRLERVRVELLVQAACFATLVSLALMVWSVVDPTPLPVMVSMSVGQAVGTVALLLYLAAVLLHQLRARRDAKGDAHLPT